MINPNDLTDVVVAGVDMNDCPDFCDAYILSATHNGRTLTDEELDALPDEWVYEQVMNSIH